MQQCQVTDLKRQLSLCKANIKYVWIFFTSKEGFIYKQLAKVWTGAKSVMKQSLLFIWEDLLSRKRIGFVRTKPPIKHSLSLLMHEAVR